MTTHTSRKNFTDQFKMQNRVKCSKTPCKLRHYSFSSTAFESRKTVKQLCYRGSLFEKATLIAVVSLTKTKNTLDGDVYFLLLCNSWNLSNELIA